jgi:hypothetical protein
VKPLKKPVRFKADVLTYINQQGDSELWFTADFISFFCEINQGIIDTFLTEETYSKKIIDNVVFYNKHSLLKLYNFCKYDKSGKQIKVLIFDDPITTMLDFIGEEDKSLRNN